MRIKYYPDADALDIRISDEKPDYGKEAGEERILHYTKEGKLVKNRDTGCIEDGN
ncbi:hypothetical protein C5S29_14420 [ANME-1 cluster archaeon GoMg3.2]|nr:hypothetical protein [ANME-1 cluster archaeon GoMg3.2]